MPQPVETVPVEEAATVVSAEGAEGLPIEASAEPVAEVAAPPVQASPVAQDAAAAVEEDVPEIEIIEPVPEVADAQPVSASEEVDLSSEWASLLEETKEPEPKTKGVPPVPKVAAPSNVEEVELPDLVLEDETPVQIPEELLPHEVLVAPTEDIGNPQITVPADADNPEDWTSPLEEISSELPPPPRGVPAEPSTPPAGGIAAQHEELLPDEELTALPLPEHGQVAAEGPEPALELPQAALPKPLPPEPEFELEQDFELVIEPEPVVPAHEMLGQVPTFPKKEEPAKSTPPEKPRPKEQVPAGVPSNGSAFSSEDFLADLAKEIDQLGMGELTPPAPAEPEPATPAAKQEELSTEHAGVNAESAPLREVFEEFRAELGEMGAEDEDLETHYNLGIAFREMGLLEEAIGEFQKVAKANDRGKAFRYAMQCCTLLGLAFMEKGQPSIAAIWYERALQTPGIDSESKLALRYDLGVAQESAGDLDTALKSFSQVYAVNIDYRDVAERISALQKPAR